MWLHSAALIIETQSGHFWVLEKTWKSREYENHNQEKLAIIRYSFEVLPLETVLGLLIDLLFVCCGCHAGVQIDA